MTSVIAFIFVLFAAAIRAEVVADVKASCCDSITLSSGGMGDFYQAERLGLYIKSGSSSSGKSIYSQQGGSNYLFYLANQGIWMVGPDVGKDYGGILNRESGECPSQLNRDWEYWSDWSESWESDMMFEAKCAGGPGPDPDTTPSPVHEPCT